MKTVIKQDDFVKARAYGLDKSRFQFISDIFDQLENTVTIVFDFMPWFWTIAGTIMTRWSYLPQHEVPKLESGLLFPEYPVKPCFFIF